MEFDIKVNLTATQILCWAAMFIVAWNPENMFAGMIESMGYRIPLLMLATGAGYDNARKQIENLKGEK